MAGAFDSHGGFHMTSIERLSLRWPSGSYWWLPFDHSDNIQKASNDTQ